jgi:hypothetical protein
MEISDISDAEWELEAERLFGDGICQKHANKARLGQHIKAVFDALLNTENKHAIVITIEDGLVK